MNLSEPTAIKIRGLRLDPDATMGYCSIPLGSIFWSDELPDGKPIIIDNDDDRIQVLRLFAIRITVWNTGAMDETSEQYWNAALEQFPDWPVFRRLHLTDTERLAHEEAQQAATETFDALLIDADDASIGSDGDLTTYDIRYDLTNDDPTVEDA
jgi:hypothetical protein